MEATATSRSRSILQSDAATTADSTAPQHRPPRFAVLASGSGSNLQAVIDACVDGSLDAEVVAVVCDRPQAGAIARAERADIDVTVLPRLPDEPRADYDRRLLDVVAAAEPDYVVLAGWMRLLTMTFLAAFPDRVINLHPARPGELPGTQAIDRALEEFRRGARTSTGVMVHLVPDEGVDDGPVLATVDVPIEPDDTVDTLAARVHAAEHRLLVDSLIALSARSKEYPQ